MSETSTPRELLQRWLDRQLPDSGSTWLREQLGKLGGEAPDRDLYLALGMVPRWWKHRKAARTPAPDTLAAPSTLIGQGTPPTHGL